MLRLNCMENLFRQLAAVRYEHLTKLSIKNKAKQPPSKNTENSLSDQVLDILYKMTQTVEDLTKCLPSALWG